MKYRQVNYIIIRPQDPQNGRNKFPAKFPPITKVVINMLNNNFLSKIRT